MRDVGNLRGIHSARTMQSTKKRSIPRIQSSAFLDLYMLQKERERLLKEDERLCLKQETNKKRLEEIELEMNKLQEVENAAKPTENISLSKTSFTQKSGVKKEWKKMSLSY